VPGLVLRRPEGPSRRAGRALTMRCPPRRGVPSFFSALLDAGLDAAGLASALSTAARASSGLRARGAWPAHDRCADVATLPRHHPIAAAPLRRERSSLSLQPKREFQAPARPSERSSGEHPRQPDRHPAIVGKPCRHRLDLATKIARDLVIAGPGPIEDAGLSNRRRCSGRNSKHDERRAADDFAVFHGRGVFYHR
jgi:hypothetical protein